MGSIQNQGSGFFDQGFGQRAANAQQQMNQLMNHQLDAARMAMGNPYAKIACEGDEKITIRKLTIREQLQAEIDEWLAPITL